MIVYDALLDDDFDLNFKNGDLIIADSDEQHLQLIVLLEQGQLRFSPLTGLGITKTLHSPMSERQKVELCKNAYVQLQLDGYQATAASIEITDTIIIKADR